MLRESPADVAERARRGLEAAVEADGLDENVDVAVVATRSVVGGGSFPGFELESAGWRVEGADAERLSAACRASAPPLIGRIEENRFVVDVRTITPGEEREAAAILVEGARTVSPP